MSRTMKRILSVKIRRDDIDFDIQEGKPFVFGRCDMINKYKEKHPDHNVLLTDIWTPKINDDFVISAVNNHDKYQSDIYILVKNSEKDITRDVIITELTRTLDQGSTCDDQECPESYICPENKKLSQFTIELLQLLCVSKLSVNEEITHPDEEYNIYTLVRGKGKVEGLTEEFMAALKVVVVNSKIKERCFKGGAKKHIMIGGSKRIIYEAEVEGGHNIKCVKHRGLLYPL